MISIILTSLTIILFSYFAYLTYKRKSIRSQLIVGQICFSCKKEQDVDDESLMDSYLNYDSKSTNFYICKECKRDFKLNTLLSRSKIFKNKIKKFIIEKYSKNKIIAIITMIILLTLYIIGMLFNIKYTGYAGYIYWSYINIYWLLEIYIFKVTSVKK